MLGIYIHIPFCQGKCGYCDFHSLVSDADFIAQYLKAFHQEIAYYGAQLPANTQATSLYIGGGTPTILNSNQLSELIKAVHDNFNFSDDYEFTIEANPGTVTQEKSRVLAALGVNRASLGVQAFQNDLLKRLDRLHTVEDVYQSIDYFSDAGITNLSLDLIHGLPEQNFDQWHRSLEKAVALQPAHLSCYSLSIEEGTPFYDQLDQGLLDLPSEELELKMFEYTRSFLADSGYQHYEISSYARPGKEGRHNLTYWLNYPYLGLGSGAHGYFQGVRYSNYCDLKLYMENWQRSIPAFETQELISDAQAMDEMMLMGLRLKQGVKDQRFKEVFGSSFLEIYPEQIEQLISRGLLEHKANSLRLTTQGIALGNMVFSAFLR